MRNYQKHLKRNSISALIILIPLMLVIASQAPKDFPSKSFDFHITKGESISTVADDLYAQKMISNEVLFKVATVVISRNRGLQAGDYKFTQKENLFAIAHRLITGDQQQPKITVIIPEGTNVQDMAYIFLQKLSDFNAARFVSLAKKDEGYLYPDTYNFLANAKPEEIIKTMEDNFNQKIKPLAQDIKNFNRPLTDIITMASIIEKEADNDTDRKLIAGVLWKRLDKGQLLQVDPPFYYITGKTSGVTYADLKIDSPYNTYKYKGLPKGPITSPGIQAIQATLHPTESKYFFYLTGSDGVMRYAVNYDGHLNNKSIYFK